MRWLAFIIFLNSPVFAQFERDFTPATFLDTIPSELQAILNAGLTADKAVKLTSQAKANAFINELYDKRFEYIVKSFNEDYFQGESELTIYLGSIQHKILQANPDLAPSATVFVYRSGVPNALSYGNGIVAYMLGLLARTQSEDQAAFVLCHELAHHYARHSEKTLLSLAKLNFDKDLKKQINEASRSDYLRYTRLMALMKNMELSLNHHSREHEFDADSLGLSMFLRTGYDPAAALQTMQILDKADEDLYQAPLDFKKYFSFKEYPFKDSWNAYTPPTAWKQKPDDDSDTSKTHPNCKRRTAALMRQLPPGLEERKPEISKVSQSMSIRAEFEIVEADYHYKKYGRALYGALQLLNRYPNNGYLHGMVPKCLFQLYVRQKNHELGKVLELPDARFGDSYNRFLTFIHKLRLSEVAALAYLYTVSQEEKYFTNEHFLYSVWLCSQLDLSRLDSQSVKEDYLQLFPKGRYLKEISRKPVKP